MASAMIVSICASKDFSYSSLDLFRLSRKSDSSFKASVNSSNKLVILFVVSIISATKSKFCASLFKISLLLPRYSRKSFLSSFTLT
jgi:hypothetical protein